MIKRLALPAALLLLPGAASITTMPGDSNWCSAGAMKLKLAGSTASCSRLNQLVGQDCIVIAPSNGDNTWLAVAVCQDDEGRIGITPRGGGVCWRSSTVKFITPCPNGLWSADDEIMRFKTP